jgi:hypothetical protein
VSRQRDAAREAIARDVAKACGSASNRTPTIFVNTAAPSPAHHAPTRSATQFQIEARDTITRRRLTKRGAHDALAFVVPKIFAVRVVRIRC